MLQPSLAQTQERVGPAPKPEGIKGFSLVHLYAQAGRGAGAQRHPAACMTCRSGTPHLACKTDPGRTRATGQRCPAPAALQVFAGKGAGSHPLPSGSWRHEFSEQQRQGLAQLEPVAGGIGEQESALSNKASILDSSSASRLFSCLSCSISLSAASSAARAASCAARSRDPVAS